jgi:hypothetical protein
MVDLGRHMARAKFGALLTLLRKRAAVRGQLCKQIIVHWLCLCVAAINYMINVVDAIFGTSNMHHSCQI